MVTNAIINITTDTRPNNTAKVSINMLPLIFARHYPS